MHLVEDGKILLASNFIDNLHYFLRNTQAQGGGMQVF